MKKLLNASTMKKTVFLFVLFCLFSMTSCSPKNEQSKGLPQINLLDINNDTLAFEDLKTQKVFFLWTSLRCGHCWKNIEFYNILSNLNPEVKFIALYEDERNKIEEKVIQGKSKLLSMYGCLNDKWAIIPNSKDYAEAVFTDIRYYPQYVLYEEGKLKKDSLTIEAIEEYYGFSRSFNQAKDLLNKVEPNIPNIDSAELNLFIKSFSFDKDGKIQSFNYKIIQDALGKTETINLIKKILFQIDSSAEGIYISYSGDSFYLSKEDEFTDTTEMNNVDELIVENIWYVMFDTKPNEFGGLAGFPDFVGILRWEDEALII